MAETIKKSRIVSEQDENLEESLLEEFNLMLKKCMSRENLQTEDDNLYENLEIIKANHSRKLQENGSNPSQEFLETEREHYGVPNGRLMQTNGFATKTDDENLYEPPDIPTTFLEPSESMDAADVESTKSVRDRMFLSTDDASCLLFTQTVTSPMLTPSEENIDFLKGFRRESTMSENTISSNSPPKTNQDECRVSNEEVIYENVQVLMGQEEEIENVENVDVEQLALEMEISDVKEKTTNFIENEIAFNSCRDDVENREESLSDIVNNVDNIVNGKEEEETVTDNVQILKDYFIKNENEQICNKSPKLETSDELDELKSLNLMKQIGKFENTSNEMQEFTNTCYNINVSTVTQSRFVETTTETQYSSGDTNLKKKKSKKSKNQHEKENISVNETNCNEDDSFYNVNVKNLCRSFGDLTKIENEPFCNWRNSERTRTKSMIDVRSWEKNVFIGVSVRILKSSFSKFDALQKKNALNGTSDKENHTSGEASNCKKCGRAVFQMEKIVAERCIYHRNCFRCVECSKQLLVDNFESHEGTLYCKPHFRSLFAPKAVEEDAQAKPHKHELIIRENQPVELPPDVARACDKPDLGLEELHSLNMKERFQVFENAQLTTDSQIEKNTVKMERSPSILSKLARFQAKGMDVGVTDDALNGVPVEASSSDEEENDEVDGEDADLVRAKRVQKEKPFHFSQMNDVKSKWEMGNQQQNRDERREERKQEIQNIRSRLFMGKQGKMKEAYQQAIIESESVSNMKKELEVESTDTRSIKDRFEKGDVGRSETRNKEAEDMSVFETGISKKSRSVFQELDATGGKPPQMAPTSPIKLSSSVRSAREAYVAKQSSEDTVRSSDQLDEITVRTADIQDRFKFFETYKEPQQKRKEFRMTPPREGQIKSATPEREVYVDPEIARSDDCIEDSIVAKTTHTATKMLSKFRQMEENLQKGQEPQGPKPLKRFTPPREPLRQESSSGEGSGSEESEEDEVDNLRMPERDLIEAQKAARTKKLKAKFECWQENDADIRREGQINMAEEIGDDQSQIETARSLRAKFESLRETSNGQHQSTRVKVNRFVDVIVHAVACYSCGGKVYPLEMITVHERTFHKNCFRCKECQAVLRMDSYSFNQGLLYCTTHFKRLFIAKGNYDTAFGLEQHKEKWNVTTVA